MFGSLGAPELIFILVLALLIFGPRKLPEIGRTLGKGLSEFRKASNDLKRSINAELIDDEVRKADPRRMVREAIAAGTEARSSEPPQKKEAASDEAEPATSPEIERTSSRAKPGSEKPEPSPEQEASEEPLEVETPRRTVARGSVSEDVSETQEPENE